MNSRNRKSRSKNSSRHSSMDYQSLEPRQMLTVDLGLSISPSATLDPAALFLNPNVNGDVGPNHIVQVINGNYSVRLAANGAPVISTTLETFWQSSGADITVGLDAMDNPILGQIQDTRVIFDHDSGNWFVSSIVADSDGSSLLGNDILLAVSRTSNPVDGFQSVQFVGDTTGQYFNSFATLAADGNGVYISTSNEIDPLNTSVSIYAIPKSDLTGNTPSAINLTRFENLDNDVVGNTLQFATDLDGDTSTSFAIGTFESGTLLSVIEVSNVGGGLPVEMTQSNITVPFYDAAPDGRQLNDVTRLNNISPEITGNAVAHDGYLWTVHSVEGTASNSAVRWYQIDQSTLDVVNTDVIEDADVDYLYPSIAVGQFGGIAIGFTGTGTQLAASSMLTLGFSSNGLDAIPTIDFPQAPQIVVAGEGNLENVQNGINPFGEYSATRVDPDEPFSFFTFQEYVSGNDVWSTSIGEGGISDIAPVINANNDSNDVVFRRSTLNNDWAEIVIDGVVTDVFEVAALDSIELNLMDGNDTLTIDNTLGAFVSDLGFIINGGAGTDLIQIIESATGSTGHRFDITGDGSGLFDSINTFTGFETIIGSNGDDTFSAANSTTDWMIFGGLGNDVFDIGNSVSGNYQLFGELGDDTYRIPLANFASIQVVEAIDSGNDALVGLGTDGDDVLLVNNELLVINGTDVSIFGFDEIEQLDFDGLGGDDIFNIQAFSEDVTFIGNAGNDVFNVASDAPVNEGLTTGILGELNIVGGEGVNRLAVSNSSAEFPIAAVVTANQITGMTFQPISYVDNFGTGDDGIAGIVLTGSDTAADSFEVRGLLADNSILAVGGGGADLFTIRSTTVGQVVLDGGADADIYRTTFGDGDHAVRVNDSGSDLSRDRFSIRATADTDLLNINGEMLATNGNTFEWDGSLENLIVDTLAGNDEVTVSANDTKAIRVKLNDGDDVGIVNGSLGIEAVRFDGEAGQDSFQFLNSVAASFVQARGGEGSDTFLVTATSFARSKVDGQNGDDNVEVVFASRDSRRVNARDTGDGVDSLVVTGTMAADRVDLRPKLVDREGEIISYDGNTDSFNVNLIGSNDTLNIFGSSVLEFDANLGVGNDTVNVFQTSTPNDTVGFDISLATDNDTANIHRVAEGARVAIFGQTGNDTLNVGSNSLDNNGNLSLIRGDLFVSGGADNPGLDTLSVNDFGAGPIAYEYTITDTTFLHSPGPFEISRPFSSFDHVDFEFVFVAGTDARNTFNVLPSLTTVFRVDGNLNPTPDNFFGDMLRVMTNQEREVFTDGSNGFIRFEDGSRNISFEEVERIAEPGSGGANSFVDPGGLTDGDFDEFVAENLLTTLDLELI